VVAGNERKEEDRAREAAACLARLYLREANVILTADNSVENRVWLAARFPGCLLRPAPVETVRAAILARYGDVLKTEAVNGLARRAPELSARMVLSRPQIGVFLFLVVALAASLAIAPLVVLRVGVGALSVAFIASGIFRAVLAWAGSGVRGKAPPLPGPEGLPLYTVLVPLYREAAVLPGLLRALEALDYPRDRLDIKLVMEADDVETLEAAERCGGNFEIVRVPAFGPRTKPKAANYALAFARGEYLVIYDAEDRPESDQLLKAVAAFRTRPRRTACLQARLNFYNADYNWPTRGIMAQTPQERIPLAA
jgi:hypothetical protein